ncbi:hypothetical protein E4T56_gene14745 [Termitomyces sp. T112]|nr:hypothetical protein E4T56_gene14745 [Termitomyces sp. T112]
MYFSDAESQERVSPYPYLGGLDPTGHLATKYRSFHALDGVEGDIMKEIRDGTEELCFLKYLQKQGLPHSMDDFHNVMSILDIFYYEGYRFAIVPRDRPSFMNIGLCTGTSRQPIHSSIMVLTTKTPSVSRYARKTN